MDVEKTKLTDVVVIHPSVHEDERGYFCETWNQARYAEIGLKENFVQDNLSFSKKNVLRGLHFQNPNAQGKLVHVLAGEVFDVAVDIRMDSPTFGEWVGVFLSSENKKQLYIPAGFAHGFCVMSDSVLFAYKCTDIYNSKAEHTIVWNDPEIAIDWPLKNPLVSDKDKQGLLLSNLTAIELPLLSIDKYQAMDN